MGLKYELVVLILGGARHHLIFDAHQFLVRMLSARTSLIYAYAQHVFKEGPFQILNFYPYTEHMRNKLMRMLRVCISSGHACSVQAHAQSGYTSVSDACSTCFEGTALNKYSRGMERVNSFKNSLTKNTRRKEIFLLASKQ